MNHVILALVLGSLTSEEAVQPTYSLLSELAPVTTTRTPLSLPLASSLPLAASFAADAEERRGSPFSYTYLEIGGAQFDIDDLSEKSDIYYINASLALGMFYLMGGYENQDSDFMSTKSDQLTLGFGAHFSMTESLDIAADLAWLYSDVQSGLPALDETGSGVQFRVIPRWMVMDWNRGGLELNGQAMWIDLANRLASDDSAFGWGLGARLHFISLLSVGLNWLQLGDDDRASLDLRVSL